MAGSPLFRSLLKTGVLYGLSEVLLNNPRVKKKIRRLGISAALVVLALILVYVTVIALLVGLFLHLAEFSAFVRPALITAGVAFLLALLAGWEGIRRLQDK